MPEPSGPPTLSLALRSVVGAAVEATARTSLLSVARPGAAGDEGVLQFPAPRRPLDDGPDAA